MTLFAHVEDCLKLDLEQRKSRPVPPNLHHYIEISVVRISVSNITSREMLPMTALSVAGARLEIWELRREWR